LNITNLKLSLNTRYGKLANSLLILFGVRLTRHAEDDPLRPWVWHESLHFGHCSPSATGWYDPAYV